MRRNIILLTLTTIVLSLQAMLWLGCIVDLYPPQAERETLFFWSFVGIAAILQVAMLRIFKDRLDSVDLGKSIISFLVVESIILVCLLSAWWKIIVNDSRPALAQQAFHILIVISVLNKTCWFYLRRLGADTFSFISDARHLPLLQRLADPLFLVFIVLLIYIPDPQAALAKMFVGEQFHHYDSVIMAPGWIAMSGNHIYVDNWSQYGLGMPIIVSHLASLFGGYSYLSVFCTIMGIVIVYYMLFYCLLRYWNRSILLSIAAILTAIKVQIFFSFAYPMTFTYPNGTILRSCFDIFFFMALLAHLRYHKPIFLFIASAIAGLSIFHIFTTGVDMSFALWAYIIMHLISPHYRKYIFTSFKDLPAIGGYFALSPFVAIFLIWLAVGHNAWTLTFWDNVVDFPRLFALGLFKAGYFRGLERKAFWDVLFGCFFPIVYVFSAVFVGILFYLGRGRYQDIFILVLSVYGLSMYHHYASMAVGNNYYMRAMPFVFIIFHWLNVLLGFLSNAARTRVSIALVCFTAFCLFTNHNFISHPNVFNVSRNPLTDPLVAEPLPGNRPYYHHQFAFNAPDSKLSVNNIGEADERYIYRSDFFANHDEIKDHMDREFDLSQDALLISELTNDRDKVALISSFEVKILMQAKRRPYFYFFPFLESAPMYTRAFTHTFMFIKAHIQKTLNQLIHEPPEYIFMERKYLTNEVPRRYLVDSEEFLPVLNYIRVNYTPYKTGRFLVAMKRIKQEQGR